MGEWNADEETKNDNGMIRWKSGRRRKRQVTGMDGQGGRVEDRRKDEEETKNENEMIGWKSGRQRKRQVTKMDGQGGRVEGRGRGGWNMEGNKYNCRCKI